MKPLSKISVAKDFSRFPAGRHAGDGPFSGEVFREKHLRPALDQYERVEVDLDGTAGYGSSFLDEAFGGLIRVTSLTPEILKVRISFVTKDQSLRDEIEEYIAEAKSSKRV
jgi:hypothetical protein